MPNTKFVKSVPVLESFRNQKIKGMFDIDKAEIVKSFDINIPIEEKNWNVGLIIGSSGSGKTTIAKECFPQFEFFTGFEWNSNSIIDNFRKDLSADQIVESLSKVGFSSPPDWLKPFNILSNGQKMRAELARVILESEKPIIYDEFTSVVDRQVAQIGSYAISKFIKKQNKQFIAVSCHKDIAEWLEADWIYDTDSKQFQWGSLRRPKIEIKIRRANISEWEIFKDHHYLSHDHNRSAHMYVGEINNIQVAWCSILHLPNRDKNLKKIHRIVVRPDYQGIGLGSKFLSEVSEIYKKNKFRMSLVTSNVTMVNSLNNSQKWVMTRIPSRTTPNLGLANMNKTVSCNRLTASFEYVG